VLKSFYVLAANHLMPEIQKISRNKLGNNTDFIEARNIVAARLMDFVIETADVIELSRLRKVTKGANNA